jgi:hypothetical protein
MFGCISIKLKNRLCADREFFNRIGRCRPLRLIDAEVMHTTAPYPGFQLARRRGLLQLVKDVGDVPAAVNHTDNLDHAGTFAVEDEIVTMREQPQPKSSVTEDLSQFWLIRE